MTTFLPQRKLRELGFALMLSGALASFLWMLLIHDTTAKALLFCKAVFGRTSLAVGEGGPLSFGPFVWAYVDPLIIGLPLAIVVTVVVSLFTKKLDESHLELCMGVRPPRR